MFYCTRIHGQTLTMHITSKLLEMENILHRSVEGLDDQTHELFCVASTPEYCGGPSQLAPMGPRSPSSPWSPGSLVSPTQPRRDIDIEIGNPLSLFVASSAPTCTWSSTREEWQRLGWSENTLKDDNTLREDNTHANISAELSKSPYTFNYRKMSEQLRNALDTVFPTPELCTTLSLPLDGPTREITPLERDRSTSAPDLLITSKGPQQHSEPLCPVVSEAPAMPKLQHLCPECGKSFRRPSALKTHSIIHVGRSPYACTWNGCSKRFNVKGNLLRHYRIHTKKKEAGGVKTRRRNSCG